MATLGYAHRSLCSFFSGHFFSEISSSAGFRAQYGCGDRSMSEVSSFDIRRNQAIGNLRPRKAICSGTMAMAPTLSSSRDLIHVRTRRYPEERTHFGSS
jgi:hypothetical protein